MRFQTYQLMNELVDGGDLGGGIDVSAVADDGGETPVVDEIPAPFIGDLDEASVLERLRTAGELPDRLSAMEGRVNEQVGPLLSRLEEIQKGLGQRVAFEPKFEKLAQALDGYDPKLKELLLPALMDDLKGSLNINQLDGSALEPHVSPMMQQALQQREEALTETLLGMLPFGLDDVVARDEQGKVLDPKTDIQRDFKAWWELQDGRTRESLKGYNVGLFGALQRFSKWREKRMQEKGEQAGAKVTRLAAGQQPSAAGRRAQPAEPKPEAAFDDGFMRVMNSQKRA